jgi:hypothetical protein
MARGVSVAVFQVPVVEVAGTVAGVLIAEAAVAGRSLVVSQTA